MKQSLLRFFRKVLPNKIKGWLYKLSVSGDVEGSMYYYINNLRKLGYSPRIILDVGAFHGDWTRNVLPIFPDAKYVLIEPQDDKEVVLKELAIAHPNVQILKTLVGKESIGGVDFFEMESGSSIYEEQTNHPRRIKTYPMKTLDELMMDQSAQGEIFIKMDVQGAELDVLDGAINTLKRCNFLLLEVSVLNYNVGAPLFAEYINYLAQRGFVLFDVCDMRRKPDGVLIQLDLIFSRVSSDIRNKVNFKRN
jgi:FkbM family methyltransferase